MTEQERAEAIKRQVEYYFSRQNLLQVCSATYIHHMDTILPWTPYIDQT